MSKIDLVPGDDASKKIFSTMVQDATGHLSTVEIADRYLKAATRAAGARFTMSVNDGVPGAQPKAQLQQNLVTSRKSTRRLLVAAAVLVAATVSAPLLIAGTGPLIAAIVTGVAATLCTGAGISSAASSSAYKKEIKTRTPASRQETYAVRDALTHNSANMLVAVYGQALLENLNSADKARYQAAPFYERYGSPKGGDKHSDVLAEIAREIVTAARGATPDLGYVKPVRVQVQPGAKSSVAARYGIL